MATTTEVNASALSKVSSLSASATTAEQLAYIAEGAKNLTQLPISNENVAAQKTAKQAIIDKAKTLLDATTSHKDLGYLTKVLESYTVKSPDGQGGFIPLDLTAPMGGINDTANDIWYPLGHNVPVVQSMRRRVVCAGNPMWGGSVYRYLDENNSNLFEDGTSATAFIAGGSLDGTLGTYQVYVETPKHYVVQERIGGLDYYACALAPFKITTHNGTMLQSKTAKAFRKTGWTADENGTNAVNEFAYNYQSAFENIYFDNDAVQKTLSEADLLTAGITVDTVNDKLLSIANLTLLLKPATYLTRATARTLIANATSKQWHWGTYSMDRLLYLCEYKNHNSQATIGGYTEGGGFTYAKVAPTGTTLTLGNKTGVILNNGSVIPAISGVSTSAVIGMSYRGVENIFGNVWKWCDGVNISNWIPYTNMIDAAYSDDLFSGVYTQAGAKQPTVNAFQSKVQAGSFFIEAVGSSSAKDITDYYYQSSGSRVVMLGGNLVDGSAAGLGFLGANFASSIVISHIGAR